MKSSHYNDNVFINCPFDSTYKPLFDAMVFTVHDCGFIARYALEEEDTSQVRIDKIYSIIADCRYGIHDISRIELDDDSGFPRFNMPLELGIFLGAKKFGIEEQERKNASCWIENRIGINNLFPRTHTPRVRSLQSPGEYRGNRRNRQNWIKFRN